MRRAVCLAALLVGGCALGPRYAGPPPLGASAPQRAFVRKAPDITEAAPAVADWWRALNDPVLGDLEGRALAGNPGLDVARSRIQQARATLSLERANRLPSGGAQATYAHLEVPGLSLGSGPTPESTLDFVNLGLMANWEFDVSGGIRHRIEGATAELGGAIASANDVQVQLTAEVAQAYVDLRERQHRAATLARIRDLQQSALDLTKQRYDRGVTTLVDVERARSQLQADEAAVADVEAELDATLDALATLVAVSPGALDAGLSASAPTPLPPVAVDVGDPWSLLQRRPDVRAAERKLAAATAQVGVARSARVPRVTFMGLVGIGGAASGNASELSHLNALALPQLQWSFLDAGRAIAKERQAEGARLEATAAYRQAVGRALQDAEDGLARFGAQRRRLAALSESAAAAQARAALSAQRYAAGAASRLETLEAERQSAVAAQDVETGKARLTASYIALQKSLGLGWQTNRDVASGADVNAAASQTNPINGAERPGTPMPGRQP